MRVFFVAFLLALIAVLPAHAEHGKTWHWEGDGVRHIQVGNNLPEWLDDDLQAAVDVWNEGLINVHLTVVDGADPDLDGFRCWSEVNHVEVCYDRHEEPWRGYAGYRGEDDGHIDHAFVWLDSEDVHNDGRYCFLKPAWQLIGACEDDPFEWQQLICHELGHTLGLNHPEEPDEESCMSKRVEKTPSDHDFFEVDQLHDHNG